MSQLFNFMSDTSVLVSKEIILESINNELTSSDKSEMEFGLFSKAEKEINEL